MTGLGASNEGRMDTQTVVRAQEGDESAFEQLAVGITDRLHGVAYRILRDPGLAEDATQQALLTLWRRLPTLRDPARFEAWAYRTLVRTCYAEADKARRLRSRLESWPQREPRAPERLTSIEERDEFDRVFRRLTVEHRTVIVLHHYLGLTHDEIGATLGIAPGAARTRLSRALKRMRLLLETQAQTTDPSPQESVR
jgi:RNA polymerase sigma-70 factor (ECF subfamily)